MDKLSRMAVGLASALIMLGGAKSEAQDMKQDSKKVGIANVMPGLNYNTVSQNFNNDMWVDFKKPEKGLLNTLVPSRLFLKHPLNKGITDPSQTSFILLHDLPKANGVKNTFLKTLIPTNVEIAGTADGKNFEFGLDWTRPEVKNPVLSSLTPSYLVPYYSPQNKDAYLCSWFMPDIQKSTDDSWAALTAKSLIPSDVLTFNGLNKGDIKFRGAELRWNNNTVKDKMAKSDKKSLKFAKYIVPDMVRAQIGAKGNLGGVTAAYRKEF